MIKEPNYSQLTKANMLTNWITNLYWCPSRPLLIRKLHKLLL
jgi:hypothetical protein